MKNKAVQELLVRLKLSGTGTVYFFYQESKWRGIVASETATKLEQIKPTAFYIFNKQPYILFFDLSGPLFQQEFEEEIHKKVWSFDQSPLAFILKDGDVEVYNAFNYEKKNKRLQEIKLKDRQQLNEKFSFWNLQSGHVWGWIKEEYYKNTIAQKRVSQKLFDNIKVVREKLVSNHHLTDDEANTLILRLIFIRYLIDRKVKLPEEFITGKTINERRLSFIDLISKPRILNRLFAELNDKFNGVLFKGVQFELSKEHALALSKVFSGEVGEVGSLFPGEFFFEIFDFSIIPVEMISGIYESLIDPETRKLHSAVYTPSFLVEYMLTETVDKYFDKQNSDVTECKVFDPSVGSGIFLVQAYRRMAEREIEKERGKKISKARLREIAVNNLFGIDINKQALKITCFSIYIAILDYVDPASILVSFKFPDLIGSNLFEADFFDTAHPYNEKIGLEKINFLLGNPPWKSDKSQHHIKWVKENNVTIARFEIAQSFLLRSKAFMTIDTISALIVTSTIFYNISDPAKEFKRNFLTTFCIDCFFDLSPVRRLIFEEKDNPCAIVFYHLPKSDNYTTSLINHRSIKSNIFLKYFKTLVIEKFDQKKIPQKLFIENDWMFKVALYGNSLDFNFLKKLKQNQKRIKDVIDNESIFKGDGILTGRPQENPFKFLIGLPILENSQVAQYYTSIPNNQRRLTLNETFLESGRRIELFEGEHIYLKAQTLNESEILVSYYNQTIVHKHDIIAITSKNKIDTLKYLYGIFLSDLYTYYQFSTSSAWGVSTRPAVRLEEYMSFPLVQVDSQIQKRKFIDLVDAFLIPFQIFHEKFNLGNPQKNFVIEQEINVFIEKIYNVTGYEKDLINYALEISRYQFQESKQHKIVRKVHDDKLALSNYLEIFINEFKNIYESEYLKIDVYPLDYFIAINFVFQNEKPKTVINFINDITDESAIFKILSSNLSITKKTKDLYIQKDIKGFEDNSFYIIKPNEYKCWHRAIAWYDVAEIKNAIEVAEIDHLKQNWDAS